MKILQNDRATGRIRFRRGWFGRMILQLEENVPANDGESEYPVWRDARVEDMAPLMWTGGS